MYTLVERGWGGQGDGDGVPLPHIIRAEISSYTAHPARKFPRCLVVQRTVWTLLVVVLPPSFDLGPGVGQCGELVRIQALMAQSAVETLHVSVLHEAARLP